MQALSLACLTVFISYLTYGFCDGAGAPRRPVLRVVAVMTGWEVIPRRILGRAQAVNSAFMVLTPFLYP